MTDPTISQDVLVKELRFLADSRQQMGFDRAGAAMDAAADIITRLSATPIEALQQRVERLEAELARRDANEKRNCINWGPCSRMDAALGDDVG